MPRTLKELKALGAIEAPVESRERKVCKVTLTKPVDEDIAREIISQTRGLRFLGRTNNNHTIVFSAKPRATKPKPTRIWKVGEVYCSYSVPHKDVVQRARERAFIHSQQFEEHIRSYGELFIAKEINPP